jgi:4a-hydroxytetrahydrobiopterin dehydratase
MDVPTTEPLTQKKCVPCEGGVPPLPPEQAKHLLRDVPSWTISADGRRLRREWTAKNFRAAVDFFNRVADLAEEEGHHPDLHLAGYRQVAIELSTHAVGGLTENDFILAAKIDQIPLATRGGS